MRLVSIVVLRGREGNRPVAGRDLRERVRRPLPRDGVAHVRRGGREGGLVREEDGRGVGVGVLVAATLRREEAEGRRPGMGRGPRPGEEPAGTAQGSKQHLQITTQQILWYGLSTLVEAGGGR